MLQSHFSRERFRTNFSFRTGSETYTDSAGGTGTYPNSGPNWTFDEVMRDCINPKGANGFRAPGPCESLRLRRYGSVNDSVVWIDHGPHGEFGTSYSDTFDVNHYQPADVAAVLPNPPVSLLRDNRYAAWSKFITQVPTDFSVINDLFEFKDLKGTFEHYKKLRKGGLKVRDIPGWANGTFLDAEFNELPLIGDIVKATQVYDRVAARIKFLIDNRDKPVQVKFFNPSFWDENPNVGQVLTRTDHTPPFNILPKYDNYMGGTPSSVYGYQLLRLKEYKATFSARCTLVQRLDGLDDSWAQLRGLIAGLGLNNPAKIVWNAIPFSFVADWFLPFGKALDNLAIQPFYGKWDLYDIQNSIKETFILDEVLHYDPKWNLPNIHKIMVERYTRKLGLSLSLEDLAFTDLNSQQQRLATSLGLGLTLFRDKKR
jgi:hypothetical protein